MGSEALRSALGQRRRFRYSTIHSTEHPQLRVEISMHLEESIRWYFTTGPSDHCSSESSGTGSPAERPLSEPHISTGT